MSTSKGTEPVVLEVLNICTTEDNSKDPKKV